jgi:hypothetical protein
MARLAVLWQMGDGAISMARLVVLWQMGDAAKMWEHGNNSVAAFKEQPELPAPVEYQLRKEKDGCQHQGKEKKRKEKAFQLVYCHVLFDWAVWVIRYRSPVLSEDRAIGHMHESQYGLRF